MITVYFLVLLFAGNGIAVIPQPFASEEACIRSGNSYVNNTMNKSFNCIPHE